MRIIITIITFVLTIAVAPAQSHGIYKMPPFERAVCCIKFFEGLHQAKDYPYIGYGHRIQPGEHFRLPLTRKQADALLRRIQKIESSDRNIHNDYIRFYCYKGKVVPSIRKRRKVELLLLYQK